jgi:signal transduction histidine kinase/ActR/RegA family two-component response regulator
MQFTKEIEKFTQELKNCTTAIEINSVTEKLVTSLVDAEFSSIWHYNAHKFVLRRERPSNYTRELSLHVKKGIIYKCFMTKKSELYNYLASDRDYVAEIDNPDNIKIKSKVMVPLMDGDTFVGIVTAYNSIKHNKKFSKRDVETLQKISPYIINAIYKMHRPLSEVTLDVPQEEIQKIESTKTVEKTETPDETLTFVANFVHDIRTPANSLYGFLDLLEGQIKDERLKEYVVNAKESASFINELTTSVLNMVATHKESSVSNVQEIDSIHFFATIAKSFASNMSSKNIDFNIYIDPMLPKSIILDSLKMKRVILNLIGNAYKFTAKGKSIEFSVKYVTKTNRIVLYVKDTGIGIPKEKQETIFEAFKQAEDTTALDFGGTGLGLFISAKYVKELGGTLALISEVEKGSTFSFDIPANIVEEEPSYAPIKNNALKIAILMDAKNNFTANNIARHIVRMGLNKEQIVPVSSYNEVDSSFSHIIVFQHKLDPQAQQTLAQRGVKGLLVEEEFLSVDKETLCDICDVISKYGFIANKVYRFLQLKKQPKVLIVDDDPISVVLIETILENEFCTCEVARDGKEALENLLQSYENKEPYDVVYIDNNMPHMNGNEVMKRLREYEQEHNISPVYTVSTSGDINMQPEIQALYNVQLGKPFKKEHIREALNSFKKQGV